MSDVVVNSYLDLITARAPQTIFTYNSFFYKALSVGGYNRVHRWTKNVDIFSKHKLFIPIHLEFEYHWCLICVDFAKKTITYYDSYKKPNFDCLKRILNYLKTEYTHKHNAAYEVNGWLLVNQQDNPLQTNLYDSGIFVCVTAEHLARNKSLDFTQKHMNQFRDQMNIELKNKVLIYPMPNIHQTFK